MAQLSRPYQFGLLGIVLLAAVWLVLLQGHSSPTTNPAPSTPAPAVRTVTATPAAPAKHAKIYKGSAPGVAGLSSAVAKARGAVETSQQNAKALEDKSAAASNESPAAAHSSAPSAASAAPVTAAPAKAVAAPKAHARPAPAKTVPVKPVKPLAPSAASRTTVAVEQHVVERQLAQGKIALILFWDPKGAEDVAVRRALSRLHGKIAVNVALAGQVASFGSITRGVEVYGTPTLLIVNGRGATITLTGLLDPFAIQQAITEAQHSQP